MIYNSNTCFEILMQLSIGIEFQALLLKVSFCGNHERIQYLLLCMSVYSTQVKYLFGFLYLRGWILLF